MLKDYLNNNKRVMIVNGKIPVIKDWVTKPTNLDEVTNHKGNYGWVLDPTDLVIDVDFRNGGESSFELLCEDLGLTDDFKPKPTVNTPNGNHYYFKLPYNMRVKKQVGRYVGIDFLSYGSYVVTAGSNNNNIEYKFVQGNFFQSSVPNGLLNIISDKQDSDIIPYIKNSTITLRSDVELALAKLDPDMDYNDWIQIGMALKTWDDKDGLTLWHDWSKNSSKYKSHELDYFWKGFNNFDGITIGTLFYMSAEADKDKHRMIINSFIQNINNSNSEKELDEVVSKIKVTHLDNFNKDKIASVLKDKYKSMLGLKLSIATIKKNIQVEPSLELSTNSNSWCKDLIYVRSYGAFINVKNMSIYKREAFDIEFGKYINNEGNNKISAYKYVADNGLILSADKVAYMPNYNDVIININNQTILNTFDKNSIPNYDDEFTKEGKNAINIIKRHVMMLCNNDTKNSDILTYWLAHNLQYTGKKITWSPIIQSTQGVGKSVLGVLMRKCLGDKNVNIVSPSQVNSDYNGWATGSAVTLLEELKVSGHNRYEVVNALKPLITDEVIQINDKYVKLSKTYNTCNYICFTNFKDCIPLDDTDRRFWVIFCEINKLSDIGKMFNTTTEEYFNELYDAINNHSGQISKWLREIKIPNDFLKLKIAPKTVYKTNMINTELSSIEYLDEIKELINTTNSVLCNNNLVETETLNDLLSTNSIFGLTPQKRNVVLKRLGYFKLPILRYNNVIYNFWSKKNISKSELIDIVNI